MKKTKAEKGITLIALIITIIVLIILAVVTIQAVQEHGIIGYAEQAQKVSIEAEEKDQIGLALSEWRIAKAQPNPPSFDAFLKGKFGEENVTEGAEGEWLVTFPKSGNQYKVKEDGTIENSKGITLSKSNLTLTLSTEGPVTDQITATLHGIDGNADKITWTIPEETIAKIDPTTGSTITVTAVAAGETTITATSGEYTAICQVTVTEEQKELAIGDFVEYNVAYTDVYNSSNKYTAKNGWRYLGKDPDKEGNSLIISTGIPARLYYYYNQANNEWFITNAGTNGDNKTQKTLGGFKNLLRGGDTYTFYTGSSTYYALQASAGLYHNFGDIKFEYATTFSSELYNKGFFTEITNGGTTYNSSNSEEKTGKDLFISNEAGEEATVRLLTLPEVNKAVGRSDINSITTITADEDKKAAVGLYRLDQLKNVLSDYDYSSTGYYWLASPYPGTIYDSDVCNVVSDGSVRGDLQWWRWRSSSSFSTI